jgi:hypothetical protein
MPSCRVNSIKRMFDFSMNHRIKKYALLLRDLFL